MPNKPNTIQLEVPRGRVAADLKNTVLCLGESAIQGMLLQNWPKVIANFFGAAGSIRIEHSEGALAWRLLLTGIGEALTELANEQPLTPINQAEINIIIERVGEEATDLLIPVDFLDHPWNLPPVDLAKKNLLAWLVPPENTTPQQNLVNLERRFDSALVLALWRTIRQDEVSYQPLLALREDPTGPAWKMLEDWRLYRAWLIAEFRAVPVFEESFALDQIYVPLNAWHQVKETSDVNVESKELRNVVKLVDDLLAWLRGERGDGRLRLISGGPGSGKSSAMKALAAELTEKGNDEQPTDVLLFPLQRFLWRAGIIESVGATLNTYADQMSHNPLHPEILRSRNTPLLLIFDGLDELTANTEVSEAISATFLREINLMLRSGDNLPVWVIVTGRDAIFGNVEGPTSGLPGELFHLLPYHIREEEPGTLNRNDYHDPADLLKIDSRVEAFQRFAIAKGQLADNLPVAYDNNDLHDVSAQPLLNYFLLTSEPDELIDSNIAQIYSRLFERLHNRDRNIGEGAPEVGKPGAGLDQELFNRVFEAMAMAAWRTGGTRAASWEEVLTEVDREDSYLRTGEQKLRDIFSSHMQDRGAQKPFRLAAAFFMRNQQAMGIEFTHKSFADYLYARRLAKALAAMADEIILTPTAGTEMLRRWEKLTADWKMSQDAHRFLELEIKATVNPKLMRERHDALTSVIEQILRDGWQVEGKTTMRMDEQRSSQMEEALFVAWHSLWRPNNNSCYWTLGEKTGDLLYRALARQTGVHGNELKSVIVNSLSGANFKNTNLDSANFVGANLVGANLTSASLLSANLSNSNLQGACLEGAWMIQAVLIHAVLESANLNMSQLIFANLSFANLCNATLERARLIRADLFRTLLKGANLKDALLNRANLEGADLEGADLEGANLIGANLEGANLIGANLKSANFRGAKLRKVSFEGANLKDAKGLPSRLRERA